jgi:hypothetical protein
MHVNFYKYVTKLLSSFSKMIFLRLIKKILALYHMFFFYIIIMGMLIPISTWIIENFIYKFQGCWLLVARVLFEESFSTRFETFLLMIPCCVGEWSTLDWSGLVRLWGSSSILQNEQHIYPYLCLELCSNYFTLPLVLCQC